MKLQMSPKQIIAYAESTARINIFEGAVRSGKSYTALRVFLKNLRKGPEGKYLVCGKTERTVVNNIIDPLQDMVGGIIRYNRGLGEFWLFDKKVCVVGASDERAEQKIRGATYAGALVDEATILPESFFHMLLSRLSIPGSQMILTTNPDSPMHWLKRDFIDRANELNIKVFKFSLEDNPVLSSEYVEDLKKEYRGLWYKRFIEGKWVLAEGAIFDFFDTKIHVVDSPPCYAKYYLLGVDYGTTNPFAAVLIGYNDDYHPSLWVEKEFYWDSKVMGCQKTNAEYADDLQREFYDYNVGLIYVDPSAASFQTELRRQNRKIPSKQARNDVIEGIHSVANYLSCGDLVICKSCTNLIKEIEGYVWDSKSVKLGEDKPLKQRDHAIDAMRYAIHSHYGVKTTLKTQSKDERYLQSQQRKWQQGPMDYPGFTNSHGWQRA